VAPSAFTVSTPSRLHFGMLSFGQPGQRQYGGLGLMIDRPRTELRIAPAAVFETQGPTAESVRATVEVVCNRLGAEALPKCRIVVVRAPESHVGLGSGTQRALAVALAICHWFERPTSDPAWLTWLAGRGARSAVGAYGFVLGGLVLEAGKLTAEELSPLLAQCHLPDAWRVLLARPAGESGLAGDAERTAFQTLPPVPPERTQALTRLARERVFPAAQAADFTSFAAAVEEFGRTAGECFVAAQGGVFAGRKVSDLVARLQGSGAQGVGQSSWGPTVFTFFPSESAAREFHARAVRNSELAGVGWEIANPARSGAVLHPGGALDNLSA
jgi:beta-ribofuranosylaminobenzene 5'-phosphate synthase